METGEFERDMTRDCARAQRAATRGCRRPKPFKQSALLAAAKATTTGVDLAAAMKDGAAVALYHTAGKGTRLAPLPGAENNNKPGVKLPALLTVNGELAPITVLECVMRQTSSYAPEPSAGSRPLHDSASRGAERWKVAARSSSAMRRRSSLNQSPLRMNSTSPSYTANAAPDA